MFSMIPNALLTHHQTLKAQLLSRKTLNQWNHRIFKHLSTRVGSDLRDNTSVNKKQTSNNAKVRLNKLISLNSHYSRREATKLITERKVTVAGEEVTTPYECYYAKEIRNALKVNGKLLPIVQHDSKIQKSKVWIANKLKGEIVTHDDPTERASLIERLIKGGMKKHAMSHFKAIGRLDMNTEGLILLTDNGMYKQEMENPSNQLHRKYRVRVHGNVTEDKLRSMRKGVEWKGIKYKGVKVELSNDKGGVKRSANTWLTITCIEGKNRLVRNICACLGLQVTRLIRTSYGDYFLNNIPPGLAVQVPLIKLENHKNRGSFRKNKNAKKNGKQINGSDKKKRSDENNIASTTDNIKPKPVQWIKAV